MTDRSRRDSSSQNHADRDRYRARPRASSDPSDLEPERPWFRSPLALLAGCVLVAAVTAVAVAGLAGDPADDAIEVSAEVTDDAGSNGEADVTDTAAAVEEPVAVEAETQPATARFGGPRVPESAPVSVVGDVLPSFNPNNDSALGVVAPVLTATDLATGEATSLEPGTRRMVLFVAHWCPHCRDELPQLTQWLESGALAEDVEVVAVSTSVRTDAENYPPSDWFNAEAWPGEVIVDDDASTALLAYGFEGFPAFIALDESGEVLARAGGNVGVAGFNQLAEAFN